MTRRLKTLLIALIFVFAITFVSCTTVPGVNPDDGTFDGDGVVNLEAPKNIKVEIVDEKVVITFDEVEFASNYSIVVSNVIKVIETVKVEKNLYSFNLDKLSNGGYTVKVRANGDGKKYYNSIYSSPVSFKIDNGSVDIIVDLAKPTNLKVTKEEQSLNISFNFVENALGYQVNLLDSNKSVVLSSTLDRDELNTKIDTSSLKAGKYQVGVYAIGDGVYFNNSDYSDLIDVEIISGTPNPGPSGGDEDDPLANLSSYYKAAQGLTGQALKQALRKIITDTHKKVTSYADLKTYLQNADEDPNNSSKMLLYYTAESITKTNNMNVWNREHVWAQSLTSGWFGTSGAGADMHHIRPCDPGVNSSRGNKKFGTASGYYLPLNVNGSGEDYRGDTARIILYLFTRYTQADSRKFTDIFQSLDLILEWNKLDPVSETETIRNEYTYKIQGNKNPFIDYPEFADAIWG